MAASEHRSSQAAEPPHLGVIEESGDGPADPGKRLEQAIAQLRARVEEEFSISERLDSKARQVFAVAAGFFAITQTVAFGGFTQPQVSTSERWLILALAVCAAVAVGLTAHRLTISEDLRSEPDIDPSALELQARESDDEHFARWLVVHLREVAERRTASNQLRAQVYREVLARAQITLILTAVELLIAMALRTS